MPKIKVPHDLTNLNDDKEFRRYSSIVIGEIVELLNGGMLPQDNFNTQLISCTFMALNTETSFNHGLNRVPSGYMVFGSTKAMNLFDGTTDNNNTKIYLQSSATGVCRVLVF